MTETTSENAWLHAHGLGETLARLGDAVIGTDVEGRVTFMNRVAEDLTGWSSDKALGRPSARVCRTVNPETGVEEENPALRAGQGAGESHRTLLVARNGSRLLVEMGVLPLAEGRGTAAGSRAAESEAGAAGSILLFRAASECDQVEEAQAQLAAIVESSRDAIISKSLDGTIRTWNAGAERLFGFTAEEAIGQPIGLIVPPDREHEQGAILARLLEGERIEHFETVRRTRDGELRYISLTVSPLCDRDGNVTGASKIARDITAQRENELERLSLVREIEEERSRLADVFHWAPSFMAVFRGPDHVYERANQRHADLVGRRDVIGKPVREALPELEGQELLEILDEVYRTGEPYVAEEMNVQFRRVPGEEPETRALEFVFQPLRNGSGAMSGILLQGIDLTERRQAEEDLARITSESARQQRLHEAILSSTPDLVYVFSLDYRILFANDSLLGMWEKESLDEVVGKRLLDVGYEPWHAEMHEREIDEIRRTGRPIRGEVPFQGAYGRRMYDYLFVPVFGADGEVEAVAGTTRDVTERREMEDLLRETDQNKDRFIALLAHELRNPLAPLRSGLQLMRLAEADAPSVLEARDIMERQLEHLVRLVDDLLDISRLSQDKMELRRATVRLSDVVEGAIETARDAIDSAGHQLTVILPPDPVYLDGDLTRLAQV
ncbi:MAG: PAS domain S-box protein, partial [Gemmatimonadales bacterium]